MIPTRSTSHRLWLVLAFALLLGVPATAAAQAPEQAESVRVSLWPEYDRSEVLVIYRVVLPAGTALPARVRLPIPADAPEITAAAYRTSAGELVNAAFTQTDGEQADVVEVEADGNELQIEFYLPFEVSGDQRSFSYVWPGGVTSQAFAYEVQQPIDATDMQLEPSATSSTTDALGFTYYLLDLGPQASTDQPEISFSYNKTTSQLSADALPPAGGLATPAPASGRLVDVRGVLPWVLLVAGVGLIAAGVVYFLRTRSEDAPRRPRHRSARSQPAELDRVDASPVFCHTCGTQATTSDRFCRQCGTALRV